MKRTADTTTTSEPKRERVVSSNSSGRNVPRRISDAEMKRNSQLAAERRSSKDFGNIEVGVSSIGPSIATSPRKGPVVTAGGGDAMLNVAHSKTSPLKRVAPPKLDNHFEASDFSDSSDEDVAAFDTGSDDESEVLDLLDQIIDNPSETERQEFVRSKFDILSTKVPFFAQFRREHQLQLFDQLSIEHFEDGDLIVKQGDYGDRMYLIVEGEAAVWREEGTTSVDITHLYQYDYFGEHALVYGQVRNANVSAIKKTTAMFLSKSCFEKFEEIRVYMIVQKIPLLSKLRADMQSDIVKRLRPKTYVKGDDVVTQGEVGDAFYMIAQGSAEVVENGETATRLYEGHTFGQMALMSGAPRLATVRAAEPLICFELKAADFKELIEVNSEFNQLLRTDVTVIKRRRSKRDARRRVDSIAKNSQNSNCKYRRSSAASTKDSSVISSSGDPLSPGDSFFLSEHTTVVKTNEAGVRNINGFVIGKVIGEGTFGKVHLCYDEQTKQEFAIKMIDRSKISGGIQSVHAPGIDQMREEVVIMKRLTHPNIVNMVAVIDDPQAQYLYIVQEYCSNGAMMCDLEKSEPFAEAQALKYFRDLLQGLDYLHANGVIHRDIKPMNLLLTHDNVVKIADFGAARMIVGGTKWISGVTGTPAFMAPELLVEDNEVYDGPAVDLWSCGATLYMMVTGVPPWMSDDEIKLAKKVKNDELVFPGDWNKRNYSPHLKNLIAQLLVKDPKSRLGLPETMIHEWVSEEGADPLMMVNSNPQVPQSSNNLQASMKVLKVQPVITGTHGGEEVEELKLRYATCMDRNGRARMEDTLTVEMWKQKHQLVFFAGVYDGHGGDLVSSLLRADLHISIRNKETFLVNTPAAITSGFLSMDKKLLQQAAMHIIRHKQDVSSGVSDQTLAHTKGKTKNLLDQYQTAGSTALICLLNKDNNGDLMMSVAWVGDSRAVLSSAGNAVAMTEDHKATREDEKARIRKAGGSVDRNGRVDGTLAVSRSFGDLYLKGPELESLADMHDDVKDFKMLSEGHVIAVPEMVQRKLIHADEFLVMASDGLWDVLENQDVVNIVREQLNQHHDCDIATKSLVKIARENGAADNISVVVISFSI